MMMEKSGEWDSQESVNLLAREAGVDRIGELAVKGGYLSPEQRDACLQEQTKFPRKMLGQILIEKHFLKATHFAALLREQLRRVPLYRRIGRYALQDVIGEGSSGVVFLARDNLLGRSVALKVLRTNHPSFDQRVRDFQKEAYNCARLSHPNIVVIHDAGQEGQFCYIAMERIEGKSLAEWAKENQGEWLRMACIFEQVSLAMQHTHQKGIIHRDVKSENILVCPDNRAYLVDFSLAMVMDELGKVENGTSLIGTPAFMSPEQIEGRWKDVDARSDIFSLGVAMYESVSGRLPFTGDTLLELSKEIRQTDPPSLEGVPETLSRICMRALEKEPKTRYQSMLELAEDLARFSSRSSVESSRHSVGKRLANWLWGGKTSD